MRERGKMIWMVFSAKNFNELDKRKYE